MHFVIRYGIPLTDEKGNLVFVDPNTGKELRTLDLAGESGYEDFYISNLWIDPQTGWTSVLLSCWSEGRNGKYVSLLFDPKGKARSLPQEVWQVYQPVDGLVLAAVKMGEEVTYYRYGYVDAETGKWAIQPVYRYAESFVNGMAPVWDETGIYIINTAGERLTDRIRGSQCVWFPVYHGNYWYVETNEEKAVLDKELNRVVDSPLLETSNWVFRQDGWVYGKNKEEWVLARGTEAHRFPRSLGELESIQEDRVLFVEGNGRNLGVVTLTDLEGNVIARWDQYSSAYMNDEGYVYAFVYGDSTYDAYYDLNGNQLPAGDRQRPIQGKYIYENGDDATTVTDLDGNVIFRWPIYSADD